MNATDLIEKYIADTISNPEFEELQALCRSDQGALRALINEERFSEALEQCFAPNRNIDIISLLSNEFEGELSEDELRECSAAGERILPEECRADVQFNPLINQQLKAKKED